MPKLQTLSCHLCEKKFNKEVKEIKRQQKAGRNFFFCSSDCSNEFKNIEPIFEERKCLYCNTVFYVRINNLKTSKTVHCSRGCASANSMTENRKKVLREVGLRSTNIGTVESISKSLKSREGWKYTQIQQYLRQNHIPHEFEFIIENSIYDLVLFNLKIIVEFDGPYHEYLNDEDKTKLAQLNGWTIQRIKTNADEEIPLHLFKGAVDLKCDFRSR